MARLVLQLLGLLIPLLAAVLAMSTVLVLVIQLFVMLISLLIAVLVISMVFVLVVPSAAVLIIVIIAVLEVPSEILQEISLTIRSMTGLDTKRYELNVSVSQRTCVPWPLPCLLRSAVVQS